MSRKGYYVWYCVVHSTKILKIFVSLMCCGVGFDVEEVYNI